MKDNQPINAVAAYLGALSVPMSCGDIHIEDGATAQAIANGAAYVKVTMFNTATGHNGFGMRVIPDKANSRILMTDPGLYFVSFVLCGFLGTNNVTFRAAIFLDANEMHQVHGMAKFGTAADTSELVGAGLVEAPAGGEELTLRLRHNDVAPVNFTAVYSSIVVQMKQRY